MRRNQIATAVLQVGVIAVALVVLPYKLFELDRYFVPKELVLHVVALSAALLVLARGRTIELDVADALLAAFLAWSALATVFATNHWLAQRALGVSVSGALVFWSARRISADAETGSHRLLVGAAIAAVCAVATGLAQAYGVNTDWFSFNRAPGGTFGNRNFVAHFAVIGLPALVYSIVTARRLGGALLGSIGVAAVAALLVLSRSRAAWLAVGASAAVVAIPLLASRKYWRGAIPSGRFVLLLLATVIGVCVAIALPNSLRWTSDSPYLDTARNVVDYSSGSGRGRLTQYANSMRIALADPVFGAGPGNWPVSYPRHAPSNDASLAGDGMTSNPWPSSDWVAFVSERGVVAAVALFGVFVVLMLGALRRWSQLPTPESVLTKVTLAATIPAVLVVGAFDACLLLAAPSLLAWCIIGAASGLGRGGRTLHAIGPRWGMVWAMLLLVTGVSIARSATQAAAIVTVGEGGSRSGWMQGATLDPGSYRIAVRVAQQLAGRGHCAEARVYARRAAALFPSAGEPKRLLRACSR